jgi:hypothetical protein
VLIDGVDREYRQAVWDHESLVQSGKEEGLDLPTRLAAHQGEVEKVKVITKRTIHEYR